MSMERSLDPVVLLVDDRKRDLDVAALIAWQLRQFGVECHLEPLEAFRAVLAEYRPGMIVFNHMQGSHITAWSRRLADIGVLTAVHLNEGILYNEEHRRFMAGKHHSDGHIDFYFSWNEAHKDALRKEKVGQNSEIVVTGVPRFDFYFEPWSRLTPPTLKKSARPRVLLCTNFQLARYADLPKEFGERAFGSIARRVPIYSDYRSAIASQAESRKKIPEYLRALVATNRYEVVLRPHPREQLDYYKKAIEELSAEERQYVSIEADSNITSLILGCDIQISCETCTTTLEAWIAKKPTIELIFDRNPLLYREEQRGMNAECERTQDLPALIEQVLANPAPAEVMERRRLHLEKWCGGPSGQSSFLFARSIVEALRKKRPSDWSKLGGGDRRRAIKLSNYRRLNQAYQFDPLLAFKHWLRPQRYAHKLSAYKKSIKPQEVQELHERFEHALGDARKRAGNQ